jgi:hypothetical protein
LNVSNRYRYESCRHACLTWTIATLLLLGLAGHAGANERYEAWQAGRPYTLAGYGTHDYGGGGKLDLEYFRASGLNTAHDTRCSYNAERQMVDVGDLPLFYFVYGNSMPDLEGFIADFEKARKHYKNIVGLQLGDEVKSSHGEAGLKHMSQIRDWVVNHPDPAVRNLLLITCTPAGGKLASSEYVRQYMNETADRMRPDAVLTQMYGIGGSQDYAGLQWFVDWCRERDLSPWVVGKTWSSSKLGVPGESELRLQKFVNLAYGVQGMFDFLWAAGAVPTVRDAGYWNFDGKDNPTTLYKQAAPVNREVANIARAMLRLHQVRAYHMDGADDADPGSTRIHHWPDSDADLPAWQRRSDRLANVTGASNRNHLLVAFFRDDAGEEYVLVVNKDKDKTKSGAELATRVVLSFHPSVKRIQRLRRDTGKVETITVDEHFAFDLPGGTGDLFRFAGPITSSRAFAGIEPLELPRLVSIDPADGGTVGRLARNLVRLSFDRDARNVHAEIRQLGDDGKPQGDDMADRLTRSVSADRRTVMYADVQGLLVSGATYELKTHWADAVGTKFVVIRGDVDGDGAITEADAAAVRSALGKQAPFLRADLNGDGTVDETDLGFAQRLVEPLVFVWEEDFEAYGDGALAGQGPWLEAETLPGSVLSKSWVSGNAQVGTAMSHVIAGSRSATTTQGGYIGNEARFVQPVGAGGVGHLIVDIVGRVHTGSFHNHGFHLWNSHDADGVEGGFGCEFTGGSVSVNGSRGVKLGEGTKGATLESIQGVGDIAVHMDIDFGAGTLTWSCTDVKSNTSKGPFVVPFTGSAAGIDGISIILRGTQGALDSIRIEGK